MNPYLRSLLGGQVTGSMIGPDFLDDMERRDAAGAIVGNEIVVPGVDRPRPAPEPPLETATVKPSPMQVNLQQQDVRDDFIMGNAKPVSMAREAEKDTALNSDRRGLFGVKGTLRDVLGVVSDAFLVQSGNAPIYSARRKQEQWADAMAGFSDGPEAERMAIERAMRVDPVRTQEFLQQSRLNQTNMGNLSLRGEELAQKVGDQAMKRSGQIMATAVASGDPAQIEQAKQAIQQLATITGIPVEQLMAGGSPELVAGREATASQNLDRPFKTLKLKIDEDLARERLAQGWANIKTAQGRLALAREIFGQNVSEEEFDQQMELLELPYRISETVSRTQRNERSNRGDNRSTSRGERTLTPRSNWQ